MTSSYTNHYTTEDIQVLAPGVGVVDGGCAVIVTYIIPLRCASRSFKYTPYLMTAEMKR
jgi:hypothetical protein